MTEAEAKREPILRVVPRPGDINSNGHIFGGWVLSQMDIAAGIVASRRADGPVATALGVGLTVLLGTGLMGLVFLSDRGGHDDAAASRPEPEDRP